MDDDVSKVDDDPSSLSATFHYGVIAVAFLDFFFDNSRQTIQQTLAATGCNDKAIGEI